jgi:hypothetical protein
MDFSGTAGDATDASETDAAHAGTSSVRKLHVIRFGERTISAMGGTIAEAAGQELKKSASWS